MKRTFSIGAKIALAVSIVAFGYAVTMTFSIVLGLRQESKIAHLSSDAMPGALDSQAASFAFGTATKQFEDALMTGDTEAFEHVHEQLDRAQQLVGSIVDRQRASGESTAEAETTLANLATYNNRFEPLFEAVSSVGLRDAKVKARLSDFRKLKKETKDLLASISSEHAEDLRSDFEALQVSSRFQRNASLGFFAVTMLVGISVVLLIVRRSIVGPVLHLSGDVASEASGIKNAAAEFQRASQGLATGASESASVLETSSAALEEMASLTRANSERAQNAKQLANQARDAADSGTAGMEQLSGAMHAIQTSSREISDIVKTIDEIAFQTNILALNAAVEAARAGEAGAGFAVVAEEVRNLAQRSANAARETTGKIEQAVQRGDQGAELSSKVDQLLTDITARVRDVDTLVAEIAVASSEQDTGIDQVSSSMRELEDLTQRNAAMAEETSSSALELDHQTERLQATVASFDQLARGSASSSMPDAVSDLRQSSPERESHSFSDIPRDPTPQSNNRIQDFDMTEFRN